MKFSFYYEDNIFLDKIILNTDDILVIYSGYHEMEIIEDNTLYFAIKNGPFTDIESDKEFMA